MPPSPPSSTPSAPRAVTPPPVTLAEARDATLIGLLVRKAIDERRVVEMA